MKKTLISTLILTALLATGCQDKEAQTQIEQLNQTVAQLSAENTQLKADLSAEKARVENIIPAIFTEEDKIFEKSETLKYPKSKEDWGIEEGTITYSTSTLKTNIDWLNELLWQELTRNEQNIVPTREQVIAEQQKAYDKTRKEMLEEPSFGFENSRWVGFIGQREQLATFAIGSYSYVGGAHGVGENRYFTVDLNSHHILKLEDLFDKKSLKEVKNLLWNHYLGDGKEEDKFLSKADLNVSENIYLDNAGVHFIYDVYSLASYAEGEQDLTLGWWELEKLLKPEFKQKNYVKFASEAKE